MEGSFSDKLTRLNFHGRKVSLWGGIALWSGLSKAHGVVAWTRRDASSARVCATATLAGAAGLYDDLQDTNAQNKATKGLKGHLGALREGRLSPGLVKMLVLLATGAVSTKPRRDWIDWGAEAAIVAGSANLLNLLDLRPGRALKAAVLGVGAGLIPPAKTRANAGASQLSPRPATVQAGLNLALIALALPGDLGEKTMLGDTGANALGAALGATWVQGRSKTAKLAVLGVITALTLLSEKLSFSRLIEANPLLSRIDSWGRLPQTEDRKPQTEDRKPPTETKTAHPRTYTEQP